MILLHLFQDFKSIYGFCPCCGEPFRLSDCTLFTRAVPPKTAFDDLEAQQNKVARAEEKLEAEEKSLREKAREQGRKAAQKRLSAFTPFFSERRLDLQDVKVLFHPVDYLAFRGLALRACSEVVFIDGEADSPERERVQVSIANCIQSGNYEFRMLRIRDDGRFSLT